MPTGKVIVLTTCGDAGEARKIARHLVEARAAACVSIVPGITSVYRWQGIIEESSELLLVIKSTEAMVERIKEEIARVHSYSVPEVIALPVVEGSPAYLAWIEGEVGSQP